MSEQAVRRMSQDEFLEWCQFQDATFELVDGVPVAMAGAKRAHDRVVVNAIRSLGNQLEGNPCQPFSDDTAVSIPNGNTRRPDVGIDCGRFDPDALAVDSPRLVIEVLSPTTRTLDMFDKLDEVQDHSRPWAHHSDRPGRTASDPLVARFGSDLAACQT